MAVRNLSQFGRGVRYALRGVTEFWGHPGYWSYAALPLALLLAVYGAAGWWFWTYVLNRISENIWAPLRYLAQISLGVLFLAFMVLAVNMLYELFGAWFFARLVTVFERRRYGVEAIPHGWWLECKYNGECMIFAAVTLVLWLGFSAIAWVIPVIGPVLLILVIGYRYALSYMFNSGFNRHWSTRELRLELAGHRPAVYGFGVILYFCMLLPLLPVLLIPGLVLGGAMLVNEEVAGIPSRRGKPSPDTTATPPLPGS